MLTKKLATVAESSQREEKEEEVETKETPAVTSKERGGKKSKEGVSQKGKTAQQKVKNFLVVHLKELASQSLIKRALSKINRLQPVFTLRFHFTLRRIRKWYLPLGSTGYHLHSFTYTIPDMRMLEVVHKTSVFADPNGLVVVSSATRAVHAMRF